MAATYRSGFNSQFAVDCNDFVTFLRGFCVCVERDTGTNPAAEEQIPDLWQWCLSAAQTAVGGAAVPRSKAQADTETQGRGQERLWKLVPRSWCL